MIFRHGFDISRHHLKGLYNLIAEKKSSGKPSTEATRVDAICTVYEGCLSETEEQSSANSENGAAAAEFSPITVTYQGQSTTLRPWSPSTCVFAAALHLRLLHFPVKPGRTVFALDCSLRTLSHIADIVGQTGRLIGVLDKNNPNLPSAAELNRFFKRHPRVSVITENIQNASLERYKQLLGLPEVSKYAFLMGLHPRLGKDSAVRHLEVAPAKLARKIFEFLEFDDALDVKCLLACYWPKGTRVDMVREVVLSHIDILRRLRSPTNQEDNENSAAGERDSGEGGAREAVKDGMTASAEHRVFEDEDAESGNEGLVATGGEGASKKKRPTCGASPSASKKDAASSKIWVLQDVHTDEIVSGGPSDMQVLQNELTKVVDAMKKLGSGVSTGLTAKEQLMLMPFFTNRTLLVMRYSLLRDERMRKLTKRNIMLPPGLDPGGVQPAQLVEGLAVPPPGDALVAAKMAPNTASMPVPAFGGKFGGGKPAPAPSAPKPEAPRSPTAVGGVGDPPGLPPPGLAAPGGGGLAGAPGPPPGMPPSPTMSGPTPDKLFVPSFPSQSPAISHGLPPPQADMDIPPFRMDAGPGRPQGGRAVSSTAGGKGVSVGKGGTGMWMGGGGMGAHGSPAGDRGLGFGGGFGHQGMGGKGASDGSSAEQLLSEYMQHEFERRRQEVMAGGPPMPDFHGHGGGGGGGGGGWRGGPPAAHRKGGGVGGCMPPQGMVGNMPPGPCGMSQWGGPGGHDARQVQLQQHLSREDSQQQQQARLEQLLQQLSHIDAQQDDPRLLQMRQQQQQQQQLSVFQPPGHDAPPGSKGMGKGGMMRPGPVAGRNLHGGMPGAPMHGGPPHGGPGMMPPGFDDSASMAYPSVMGGQGQGGGGQGDFPPVAFDSMQPATMSF
eukprot:TRINITY_DN8935_c0_g1_i1.p1 TRINITY_DN8935_c0_g1~~TRINITY_DN8935_c0_g1_i1.p1  ORF type:complete len:890 (+),score=239.02 TRINITY_DN8935_c0_g1_i1:128-2797(+)